ncbi:MAG: cohesin domain-containing protein, partial [Burkholderiales bacterium]
MKARFLALLLWGFASLFASTGVHAYALFLESSAASVDVGQSFSLSVKLDDPASMGSFDFTLGFDPLRLQVQNQTIGGFDPAPDFSSSSVNNTTGEFTASAFQAAGYAAGAPGPVTLSVIDFKAIAAGSTVLSVTAAELGLNLPDPNSTATPNLSDAVITIRITNPNRVPEPGSLALAGLA